MSTRLLNLPSLPKWWKNEFNFFLIILFSIIIHAWCVWQLPTDYDEPVYVQAGSEYAKLIKNADILGIINYPENREHPPLIKILYSIPFLIFPDIKNTDFYLFAARSISAVFGVFAVAVVAKKNLWAGLFLAFHSMTIKYTSQAYLESLPMLMVIISVLALEKAKVGPKKYFWISSLALGIAGAGKYPYLLIAVVLIAMLYKNQKFNFQDIVKYFIVALLTFFLLNPDLWINPVNQIIDVVRYHTLYSQSAHVLESGYVWYQPIRFISSSVPWHPEVFFFLTLDELVFGLTLVGIYFEFREKGWTVVWFLVGILFLLIWPTKWPQYTLFLTPVMAIIAGKTVTRGINWLRPQEEYWNYFEEMLPQPPKITWWVLGIFVGSLFVGKLAYEFSLAVARQGWNLYTKENSPLSSNLIYQINTDKPGEIAIATDQGLNIWRQYSELFIWGEQPQNFNIENSELNSNIIRSIAFDSLSQVYWLGTDLGVSKLSQSIENYDKSSIGCTDCQVNDIFLDLESNIWVATNEGIYQFDNKNWTHFSSKNPGIENETVLTVFIQEYEGRSILWAGTLTGISKYDLVEKKWTNENWAGSFFGWGGVSDIGLTSDGKIVACTFGGGIFFWDGNKWDFLRNTNAPLKSNTVLSFAEDQNHAYWFGFGYPTEPGGYLMRLDSKLKWTRYFYNTSGYHEGEPFDLDFDKIGRLWIATNGGGVQMYEHEPKNGVNK
ncbi:MAG: hypothetical protein CVU46_09120 [Chloroflexi bacterium HGW-Chloroflexi-8]|nr:MAG: hypothetical protein CVU46_09120 [Chloroflexi bacterium HGW-Chloroflexi-8]